MGKGSQLCGLWVHMGLPLTTSVITVEWCENHSLLQESVSFLLVLGDVAPEQLSFSSNCAGLCPLRTCVVGEILGPKSEQL